MREEVARIFTEKRAYRDAGEVGPMLWVAAPLRFHDLSTLTALEACESVLSAEDSVEGNAVPRPLHANRSGGMRVGAVRRGFRGGELPHCVEAS